SSLFDFITIFVLLFAFHYSTALFRTGWFVESLLTQTIIIFVLRTRRVPFFKSIPSSGLILSCLIGLLVGLYLPFSPIGHLFAFLPLPALFFGFVFIIVILYITLVEVIKKFFYSFS
ncbi:MAG TPA: cation transporting ATPase C-terminal domain-containing protein, partial [Candidatus Saccharimonadales bacterium]|nr:cation transporting ATPase C-terminal domain-containing protein [Candidatus Saccharimonadales bacterium]